MGKIFGFLVATVLLNNTLTLAQDGEIADAKLRAEAFSLECEFAFPEYRMVAEITAEASPDSEYFFRSKATMEILQTNDFRVESLFNDPKLIADDRLVKSTGGTIFAGPFTRFEKHQWLFVDDNMYDLQGRVIDLGSFDGKRHPLNLSEPIDESSIVIEIANIQPFDWPLFSSTAFERKWKDRDMYKYTFGKDRRCVFASSEGGLLESHWVKPSNKVVGVSKIVFENELIVSNQIYVYARPIDLKSIDLKTGWLLVDTHIRWEKKGDSNYPKTVVSNMRPDFGKSNSVLLVANIKLSCPGDPDFDQRKIQVQKRIDTARAAKAANDSQSDQK